ncbi:MAG: helix-turn-helix domain-containing protein [Bacteroidales bacterium]|nr:helix-turn-helix domain-containing protein [Bacteroidales bacterium]MCM1417027.1 helix-turn-helix domain-containing protein [bacterium]MCM1423441.1 helix-turn-helix domain-containing protein [bacterium]
MKNYSAFCKTFYASHFLPVVYYEDGTELCAVGLPAGIPVSPGVLRFLLSESQNPAIYTMPGVGFYGMVRLENAVGCLVIGPARSGDVLQKTVQAYMSANAISRNREEDITQFMQSLPCYSYNRFVYLMLHLHLVLNGEEVSILDRFGLHDKESDQEIAVRHTEATYQARDERQQHGTYFFEKQMLELVRQGEPEQMRSFLLKTAENQRLVEGVLADTPLRQAKNVFVGTVTIVGKMGAIPGGMDVEQAYYLMDTYIQECEYLQSLEAIKNLQYNMLLDFTSRVRQSRLPAGISDEVYACIQYIGEHLNDGLAVQDIASHINRGKSYLEKRFKAETGMSVGEYVTECRMREAKLLLKYTDKSLAEISEYLHFSNQPYFQNVFKKTVGVTPAKYRREHSG